jgi:hypothetical protein
LCPGQRRLLDRDKIDILTNLFTHRCDPLKSSRRRACWAPPAGCSCGRDASGELGPEIRWLTSYVTDDKIYCVYVAPDEDILLEHARCGGFPADRISKVATVIDPSTGD